MPEGIPADPVPRTEFFDPSRALANELRMGVTAGFSMTAVGDCITSRPLSSSLRDDGFRRVMDYVVQSDVRYGNLETTIVDVDRFEGFPYSWNADWPLVSLPAVAGDLASLGFQIFSRANNHSLDWGIEGMRETARWLDAAGLVHAGTGERRGFARAPRYLETPKGRIALVSFASSYRPTTDALPSKGAAPGRPGVSALSVSTVEIVPQSVYEALRSTPGTQSFGRWDRADERSGQERVVPGRAPQVTRFGVTFEAGPARATRFEMEPDDVAEILLNIRQGKQHSDFVIASIHTHQSANAWDFGRRELQPADFLRPLARAAIDAGASAFVTTGNHNVGPVEVYRGKPILYGLGNFFWSDIQEPVPHDLYQAPEYRSWMQEAFEQPERATDADLSALITAQGGLGNDFTFESIMTRCEFEPGPDQMGRLTSFRLYPLWLRRGEPLTRSGVPTIPAPERAAAIVNTIDAWSSAWGTSVELNDDDGWPYGEVQIT